MILFYFLFTKTAIRITPPLTISDEEIIKRTKNLPDFDLKIKHGYLGRYAKMVTSANTGAILKF